MEWDKTFSIVVHPYGDSMDIFECIRTRRSIRTYTDEPIDKDKIQRILETAVWAPSGKNGQPWKLKVVIEKGTIERLADLYMHNSWMKNSNCIIAVFLDNNSSYNYIKDVQSCGALIQNILLAANGLGIGSCWIGGMHQYENEIIMTMGIEDENLELMGMVTLGYKGERTINPGRKAINTFLL